MSLRRLVRLATRGTAHIFPTRYGFPRLSNNKVATFVRNINSSVTRDDPTAKPIAYSGEEKEPYSQLCEVVKTPIWELQQKLRKGDFQGHLARIKGVENPDELIKKFQAALHNQFKVSLNNFKLEKLDVSDYINPRIENIVNIICLINDNQVPYNLPEFYDCSTKNEFLTMILSHLLHKEYINEVIDKLPALTSLIDFSNPAEWFPEARKMKRKIIMHVGPTNSGKTYNSLKKLAEAKSGYYAGPLRLLAREIYERFNDQGIKCNLVTGEEVLPSIDEFGKISDISSGTIEMIPLNKKMDICIIDEIQMLADDRRGAAWTSAVLGVLAKEIHACGEESAVPLIKKLTKITGDELEVRKYKRLGKLTVLDKPVSSLKKLRKGDCVIAFSKRKILELKCEIERNTDLKVGVIYGALPPEIRSKEANGFNNGQYDVLVASDAVGMGLNLKILRIVFYTVKKFNGSETIPLTASSIKQIAGRAGRFSKVDGELEGFVTSFSSKDLKFIREMMKIPNLNLSKACLWPTNQIWTYYMTKFPKHTSFYKILKHFEKETVDFKMDQFFITELDVRYEILKLFLQEKLYRKTTIQDQLLLSLAPINIKVAPPLVIKTAFKFFQTIADCETKSIFDFGCLHSQILQNRPKITATADQTVEVLQALEEDHKLVLMFLWLAQRWPTLFVDKESAQDIKTLIEKRISEELLNLRRIMKHSKGSVKILRSRGPLKPSLLPS
ncbi:uncharacterized protein PRCAT00004546001 [Priceomyces carsonii]|uniref:uncharacterized protein n=1 Tax=Priceomyces carsonii TaxID=28549 RepID=UPI002ED9AEAF|nr:unnamed protein product [Priceomyces carsonii]